MRTLRTALVRAAAALSITTITLLGSSAFAGQASAITPAIGTFPISETFVDDGVSEACGFPVTVTIAGDGRFQVFFDQSGNPIRVQVEVNDTGTFSANGLTVDQASCVPVLVSGTRRP